MTDKRIDYRKDTFNDRECYCNSERIVKCAYQYTQICPRVCNLFNDENENYGALEAGILQVRKR
jgi:hypothetical protein